MFKINANCRFCNTCIIVCPVGAIEKTYPIYRINPDTCAQCGECRRWCSFEAIEYVSRKN